MVLSNAFAIKITNEQQIASGTELLGQLVAKRSMARVSFWSLLAGCYGQ